MEEKGQVDLEPTKHAGGGSVEEEKERLSTILERFNERFGRDFSDTDRLLTEMEKHMRENEEIQEARENNTYDNFPYRFTNSLMDFVVSNIELKQDFEHNTVDVYLDHSPEYGSMGVYSKIKEQMNAHSLYRRLGYQVNSVKSVKSEKSFAIQRIDMLIGIIVYLIEQSYTGASKKDIVKSDLMYRFLIEKNKLNKFQSQINLFKWDEQNFEPIEKIPIRNYLS